MQEKLRIATCQFPVSNDIEQNAKYITRFLKRSAAAGADIVHFPETALSGYCQTDLAANYSGMWTTLRERIDEIRSLTASLSVWAVVGSGRQFSGVEKTTNCAYVISDTGTISTYDKRRLTPSEENWYAAGSNELVVDIRGVRCGFLICYEACFPTLWENYANKEVRLIFHSSHNVASGKRPLLEALTTAQIRTRAADHGFWVSHSTSSAKYAFSAALVASPDGSIKKLAKHRSGILWTDVPRNSERKQHYF